MPEPTIKSKQSALKVAKMLNSTYGPIRERENVEEAVYTCLIDLYHFCAHWASTSNVTEPVRSKHFWTNRSNNP